jgi:gas vesicle protein
MVRVRKRISAKIKIPLGAVIYGTATSTTLAGVRTVQVYGTGGLSTALIARKGDKKVHLPPASLVGISPNCKYVAWDGENYILKPTLESIKETDNLTLIAEVKAQDVSLEPTSGLTDKPPLGDYAYEQIEVELHRVDKTYWDQLSTFQMPTTTVMGILIGAKSGPLPPKRPLELSMWIGLYAQSLFDVEASKYPPLDPNFCHWLIQLAIRLEERVMRRIGEIEKDNLFNSLSYHGLTGEHMREVARKALQQKMQKWPQSKQQSQDAIEPAQKPRAAELWSESRAHTRKEFAEPLQAKGKSISEQLKSLQSECRMTAEEIAEPIQIEPRSVYRHLSGDTMPRRRQIAAYEKLFSERTGRAIRIDASASDRNVSKRQ